ncbi:MAG: beta-galactosidase [Armatimonadota bacterium]|nr:MAG: beta-galactosidase [Armatimonadota bacterium]
MKNRVKATLLLAAASVIAVGAARGQSQETALEQLRAGHKVDARIGQAPSGKMMLLIDGQPLALFWANLTDGADPDYRRAGLNTVFAELAYAGDAVPLDEAFREWDDYLLGIKQRGFYVIVYLHNSIHAGAGRTPWAFDAQWRSYVQSIVRRYRDTTNLIGWCFSDELGDALTYPNEAFRDFLRREYGSIEALNAAWDGRYSNFGEVTLEYQRQGHGRPEDSMVTPSFPFGIGPKAFDSARFKLDRVAWANRQFESAVREVDPATPIWSGANNLGWPATRIPRTWGAFFDFYPGSSGSDFDTHHVWMVDVGRGPNVRPAMPMLLPEDSARFHWHLDARVIRGWMAEAALHGAAGITFWPWSFLGVDDRPGDRSSSAQRIDMCETTIRTLRASGIFEMLPRPTIAVLYEPYAEGWGAMSQVYGLLRHPSGEPVPLMRELKYGTRYGQVDYLTTSTLSRAELDNYGVILAPFAADIGADAMRRLTDYVRGGGVLFADVGFGCIQAGKVVTGMTDAAKRLFGIRRLTVSDSGPGRFVATGDFGELLGGLQAGVDATDKLREMALDVEPSTAVAALRGPGRQGLYVNRVGEGYAIFYSALAWSSPSATDPLMGKIHNALFARRARIALTEIKPSGDDAEEWSQVFAEPYFAQGCEVARFAQGYALQNRTDTHRDVTARIDERVEHYGLAPRSVVLVRGSEVIPLGSGVWPAETGPEGDAGDPNAPLAITQISLGGNGARYLEGRRLSRARLR